jgi:DNA-binding NarL/FixJ family response regulator
MIRVSIVEDHVEVRNYLINAVKADPELLFASSYETVSDAIKFLPVIKPEVVLLDINLNGENGIEVINYVRKLQPSIQFLMCTIYSDDDKVFASLKAGASGYMLKYDINNLTYNIKDLYNGGSPMSSIIARKVTSYFLPKENEMIELSKREIEILKCISNDDTYKEAGLKLGLSPATIRNHLHHIYSKLHVKSRMEAVKKYLKTNF